MAKIFYFLYNLAHLDWVLIFRGNSQKLVWILYYGP